MRDLDELDGVARVRRRLLQASVWAAGSILAGTLPYERPVLRSFFGTRSAWAQASGPQKLLLSGTLGRGAPGVPGNTGSDWWRLLVLQPAPRVTIQADSDSFLDLELFLFAPGADPRIGTNLLTGSFAPYDVGGVAAGETVTLTLAGTGGYVLAIEDARPPGSETAGQYLLTITADPPLGGAVQIEDETTEIQGPNPGTLTVEGWS